MLDDNAASEAVKPLPPGLTCSAALGLLHRHVTEPYPYSGAIRKTWCNSAVDARKRTFSELLQRHDLLALLHRGRAQLHGRAESACKDRMWHAADAGRKRTDLVIVPMAVAYDVVLEGPHPRRTRGPSDGQSAVRSRSGGDGGATPSVTSRAPSSRSARQSRLGST